MSSLEEEVDSLTGKRVATARIAPAGTTFAERLGERKAIVEAEGFNPPQLPPLRTTAPAPAPVAAPAPAPREREESVKALSDILAKYRIGEDPDYWAKLFRTYPRYEGATMIEGYLKTYHVPFTEESIAEEYGGGRYRVDIYGVRTDGKDGEKKYASFDNIRLPGDYVKGKLPIETPSTAMHSAAPPVDSGMVGVAFEAMKGTLDGERRERLATQKETSELIREVKEQGEQHTQRLLDMQKEAHETRVSALIEQLRDKEERVLRIERTLEMQREKMPDPFESFARMKTVMGPDADAQNRMLDSILQKHQTELQAIRQEHAMALDRHRDSFRSEADAIRASASREVEAERIAASSREKDLLRQLEHEREERRRDADRFRDELATREQLAKDRAEASKTGTEAQWQARFDSLKIASDLQNAFLKEELDRKTREVEELRSQVREERDPLVQIEKLNAMKEGAERVLGLSRPSTPEPSISSGPPESTFDKLVQGLMENGPKIAETFQKLMTPPPGGGGVTPPQPGQIIQTPQGVFQVVLAPNGSLGMVPYLPEQPRRRPAALPPPAQQQPRQQQPQPQRRAQPQPQPQMPDMDDVLGEGAVARRRPKPQRPRPQQQQQQPRQPEQAQQAQQAPAAEAEPAQPAPPPPQVSPEVEKQITDVLTRLVSDATMSGEDPDTFVAGLAGKFPDEWLKMLAGVDPDLILTKIREAYPTAAAVTPAGSRFFKRSFALLRTSYLG